MQACVLPLHRARPVPPLTRRNSHSDPVQALRAPRYIAHTPPNPKPPAQNTFVSMEGPRGSSLRMVTTVSVRGRPSAMRLGRPLSLAPRLRLPPGRRRSPQRYRPLIRPHGLRCDYSLPRLLAKTLGPHLVVLPRRVTLRKRRAAHALGLNLPKRWPASRSGLLRCSRRCGLLE